jgi:hypothetical protein
MVLFSSTIIMSLLHPLHLPSPNPLLPTPKQDLFYLPVHFKCVLIVQRSFAVVFHTYMYYTLIRLTLSMTLFFSIPPTHQVTFSLTLKELDT